MSAPVCITTITPPELKTVKGEQIVKFVLACERYKRQGNDVNRTLTSDRQITPAGYKSCVSAELLLSLTTLRTFPERTDVSQVTDADVGTWITSRSRCASGDTPGHVKSAIGRVRFKPDRDDPQGAALSFFMDIMTELRRSRVAHVIEESSKTLIALLIPKLEPPVLREAISSAHDYWPKDKRHDFHHFMGE